MADSEYVDPAIPNKWFTGVEPSGEQVKAWRANRPHVERLWNEICASLRKAIRVTTSYHARGLVVTLPCPWLSTTNLLSATELAVRESCAAIGICELPPGSNRSPEIDAWNLSAGVPVGSAWCASFAGAMWKKAGLQVPQGYAACETIRQWAIKTGRFGQHVPTLGGFVLYGDPTNASHIGVIVRVDPLVLSVEGYSMLEPGSDRNGVVVTVKEVTPTKPVIGYVSITSS